MDIATTSSPFLALPQPIQSSNPCITTIDIDRPARALAVLRLTDGVFVLGASFIALGIIPELLRAIAHLRWTDVITLGATIIAWAFAAYTAWRNVGVIDPRVWRSYLWAISTVTIGAALGVPRYWRSDCDAAFDGRPFIVHLCNHFGLCDANDSEQRQVCHLSADLA
jgi:hypothetical protein